LARVAADVQRLAIKLAAERIKRGHDLADCFVTMLVGVWRRCLPGPFPDAGICFPHHLLAEIHADQVVLKNVVVEHVFRSFAEVHDALGYWRWTNSKSHGLRVSRTGCVIVATDAADAARDEVGVTRILAFHENGITAKDG